MPSPAPPTDSGTTSPATAGEFKVMQALVPPRVAAANSRKISLLLAILFIPPFLRKSPIIADASNCVREKKTGSQQQPQTLGPALKTLLPALFPSSRDPVLAGVVMHGAPVPFSAPLEELMREAAYPDGWVCLIVELL